MNKNKMNQTDKGLNQEDKRGFMTDDVKYDTNEEINDSGQLDETEEIKPDNLKKSKHKESKEKNEAKKAEEEAIELKYLRLMADFQNYKRRVEKEKTDIYAFANEKIVLGLLDVIDSFERALSQQSEEENIISEGMNMVYKQLRGALEKSGLQEIDALGQEFDPNLHNAVMMEESGEYEPGKVTLVLQKGYFLNKKVIRHTMVKVAK
jgi:molecular chaperone GrpE